MIGLMMAAVVTVAPGGPVPGLAAAVRLAAAGDTIIVLPGRYRDSATIRIDKPLVILGRGGPVLEGRGDHGLILVTADGVTLAGLVLRTVGASSVEDRAAIRVEGADCRILGNVIEDAFFGIFGARADGCLVEGNRITGTGGAEQGNGNAIQFWSTRAVTIRGNTVSGHRDGIYLEFVTGGRLEENRSVSNRRYGLHFMFSDSCDYRANRFERNGAGVAVMYSARVRMAGNTFGGHRGPAAYGLLLKDLVDSELDGNRFADNTTALYLEGATRLAIRDNTFEHNGWALRLLASSVANRFSGNVFAGNAFDVATNSRSSSSRFEANYWDRYRGFDLDRDGRGDVPFHPVRLFSLVVERHPPALILLRSLFVDLLDAAERVLPLLTPASLVDASPLLERPR